MRMSFEEAVKLVKRAVKDSHLTNQKHIDLTVIPASETKRYNEAMMILREKVNTGEMTEDQLKTTLGLN